MPVISNVAASRTLFSCKIPGETSTLFAVSSTNYAFVEYRAYSFAALKDPKFFSKIVHNNGNASIIEF